jgi:hypothetical protein
MVQGASQAGMGAYLVPDRPTETESFRLFRARRACDGVPVVLKVLKPGTETPWVLRRAELEF